MPFVNPAELRAAFSTAMSSMYRAEVPAYGQLMDLVADINARALARGAAAELQFDPDEDLARLSAERHGAIRLGTAQELDFMRRVFAVMGMFPVGYYDLASAGVPVHSTDFRPIGRAELAANPFRVFTSLLRLELIADAKLRREAQAVLQARDIFTPEARRLTEQAEREGGLNAQDAKTFVAELLETFRWRAEARVSSQRFADLIAAHRLVADVVSFPGPHINHLTPRTLDIDAAQAAMQAAGLPAKAVIEGPPHRLCPILLRQTAFKALDEPVRFPDAVEGQHTARFGEIEQRGVALTPKGHALYDRLLGATRAQILPSADGKNAAAYVAELSSQFEAFPDTWRDLHDQGLAYFKYARFKPGEVGADLSAQLDSGAIRLVPQVYEDFLPVSAAGIFQSNLGDEAQEEAREAASRAEFEQALGATTLDPFALYQETQQRSLAELGGKGSV